MLVIAKYSIKGTSPKHLFDYEVERIIKGFADKNNLKLPSAFCRSDYEFFTATNFPEFIGYRYDIIFSARNLTADEILGDQIKFQIKQLE